ncbi:MAG: sulfatase-like hydrolase/transferase [Neisseriaceae bacterium]|nr:sulfatase-like hydrolase/transferase [Neisseriaceae bacterium]
MSFTLFKKLIPEWLLFILIALITFFVSRYYLYQQIRSSISEEYQSYISSAFLMGFRFDIKIIATILSIFVLFAIIGLLSKKLQSIIYATQRYFLIIILTFLFTLTISNIFYYSIYGNQFDVFIFGLFDEDTKAVLNTIWKDIPIIKMLLSIVLFVVIVYYCFSILHNKIKQPNNQILEQSTNQIFKQSIAVIIIILFLVLGIRGSLGTFPLRQTDIHISQSTTLNSIVSNAIYSIKLAVKEYKNSAKFIAVSDEDGQKLFSILTAENKEKSDFNQLIVQTPKSEFLEQNQPNVVFALMESFGTHFLLLDEPKNRDLLGALRYHFDNDFLYLKFISEGDGTSDTLHRFFIRSPLDNISQSSIKNKSFATNMFQPYKDAGYKIIFITSGNGGWRNLETFAKHLGVDEFIDEHFLKMYYPQSDKLSATWGVPDEFMFQYAEEKLKQEKQPVFIFLLSITNHPPYQLPENSQRKQFSLSEDEKNRFQNMSKNYDMNEIMNTYLYANNALGEFISHIKKDNKTIIAATGDHNMRGIGYPNEEEIALGHAVPFYLYIPKNYQQYNNAQYSPDIVGSHKDIMPTLYENSLSEKSYIRTGCNLTQLQEIDKNSWCGYGYNTEVLILQNGMFNLYKNSYHRWQDKNYLIAEQQSSDIPNIEKNIIERGKQYTPFLNWTINKMAME